MNKKSFPVKKSEEEWKKILSPEQYQILRKKGTEVPFRGVYNNHFEKGLYNCSGCGKALFEGQSKFHSACGWPSFDSVIKNSVEELTDFSHGLIRTEVVCKNCGGHQGHVFNDGETSTGLRYCINSTSISFQKESFSGKL